MIRPFYRHADIAKDAHHSVGSFPRPDRLSLLFYLLPQGRHAGSQILPSRPLTHLGALRIPGEVWEPQEGVIVGLREEVLAGGAGAEAPVAGLRQGGGHDERVGLDRPLCPTVMDSGAPSHGERHRKHETLTG